MKNSLPLCAEELRQHVPPRRVILSRTDGIGDVVLTLPMAGLLKKSLRDCEVIFIASAYAGPVARACVHVDGVVDWSALSQHGEEAQAAVLKALNADAIVHVFPNRQIAMAARRAAIPVRIGTNRRLFHWISCSSLVNLSRRKSLFHEAQLNLRLLAPLGVAPDLSRDHIADYYGLSNAPRPPAWALDLVAADRCNVVLHPRSKGSAREWGLDRYSDLVRMLPPDRFRVFVTGSSSEGDSMRDFFAAHGERLMNLTGRLSLPELIGFISITDALVAGSTGPLHLAAALGRAAIGLFSPARPIWPARWAPLGPRAAFLVIDKKCNACRHDRECRCLRAIEPKEVLRVIEKMTPQARAVRSDRTVPA